MKDLLQNIKSILEKYVRGPVYFDPSKFNKHQIQTTYNGELELIGDNEELLYNFMRNIFAGIKRRGGANEADDKEVETIIIKVAKSRQDTLIAMSQMYNNMNKNLQEVYSKICEATSKEDVINLILDMDCRLLVKDDKRFELLLNTYTANKYQTEAIDIMGALYVKQAQVDLLVKSLRNDKNSNNTSSLSDDKNKESDPEDDDEKY